MAFTTYRYVLLRSDDLNVKESHEVGELTGATGRTIQRKLNGIDTASVVVSLTDPVAHELLMPSNPDAEYRLKIYRQQEGSPPALIFYGPVVDVETIFGSSSGSVQINAASPLWYLTHRYAFKEIRNGFATQKPFSNSTRVAVVMAALADVRANGWTGLAVATPSPSLTGGTVGNGDPYDAAWRNMAELLTEMAGATGDDGFDFYVQPGDEQFLDNISNPAYGAMGTLYLTERRGVDRPEVIFETGIGTTNNAVEARQSMTRIGLANAVYHVPDVYSEDRIDGPDKKIPVISSDRPSSIAARSRHEAILRDDIQDIEDEDNPANNTAYRRQLVELHANVRQRPRRVITFEPAPEEQGPSVPRAFADYDIGDTIRLRVVSPDGRLALNESLRIYGIDTEINDGAGTGRHTLTLTPEN